MQLDIREDLWHYLARVDKPIVMYGMGNGADKILAVCDRHHIQVQDFFASDGFVRGHSFHGKRVLSYSELLTKYEEQDFIILLSFATSLPDVLARIYDLDTKHELYAPDVPVFGDNLFDLTFFRAHEVDLGEAYALLADEESRRLFRLTLLYKLTGKICYLREAQSTREEIFSILSPERYRTYADLGAYNGDTIRELLSLAPHMQEVLALEPDRRNFKKLSRYAEEETRCRIHAIAKGAWNKVGELAFDASGNRNANLQKEALGTTVEVDTLDRLLDGHSVDYIKYDVEGAEREALTGTRRTLQAFSPDLLVSAYHRSEDLFLLPRLIHELQPAYRLYLRRYPYIPAWDLNLLAVRKENGDA